LATLPAPRPATVLLENDCHEPQGWNNCGPATVAMALRFYGWTEDQYVVAAATKPDRDDKNVSPEEMVDYALSLEHTFAIMGYATDVELLKELLGAGYPAIVETWFIPEPDDEMGHYRLLTGYDDTTQAFVAQDSYLGANQRLPYDELESMWKVFNRVFVVICPSRRANELLVLLGHRVAPERMYVDALALALAEIEADPDDRYAWFNAGTNYLALGQSERAAAAYDQARLLKLPWRLLWYQFGPFEAYLRVGRYQEVIALADANLRTSNNLEESYYYRALARRALGDEEGAKADLEAALRYNALYEPAQEALGD
jgi:tetratricopeptide (TPR) repeat protein